ncbi:MAG: D-alanine--D-alanine ligase [gamma proteobacterium symbiont of Bathyaustriella thionipta]|nr:D-alanine--D-alanine ligase [gamma proteobacterium symbiont of Bathyaustriella thionipta]
MGRVAVLMGGDSAEREISLLSGDAVLQALLRKGVDAHAYDPAANGLSDLGKNFSRAFIALHGRGGEDGQIQGALQTLGLPYTGSGVLGSAIAMDKYRCKLLWQGLGVATPAFFVAQQKQDLQQAQQIDFPLMVKPLREGSSIGMARVDDARQLEKAWQVAREYDDLVLVEQWIAGEEYTGAILDDQALPLIRLQTSHDFYDYAAKYEADDTDYICPCGLPDEQEEALQGLLLKAFRAIDASGWGRVDFMLDEQGRPWFIEVNTVPGMTSHSLVPMAAQQAQIGFDDLVWKILLSSEIKR